MTTTNDYLNAVKAKTGAASDYALAPKLGLTKQMISRYRLKKDYLSDEYCLKVASILEIDPAIVLAAVHAERAKTAAEKTAWTAIFERLGGVAAAAMLGIMLNVPNPAEANTGAVHSHKHNASNLYIMRNRRKKIRLYNPFENLIYQLLKTA